MIVTFVLILFFLMVIVGGNRGLDSFLALLQTIVALLANVYLIAWGLPAIPVTIMVCISIIVIVIYLQNGKNIKMHAAAISVAITIILVILSCGSVLLSAGSSGYNEIQQYEEISMYLSSDLAVSMPVVMMSSIVMGLLGAVMDTAVAITTTVNEIFVNNPNLTIKQLFHAGMQVGKDILGTTVNTLFFACLGECIMLAVLFMKNEDNIAYILNSKVLFQEISGVLIGGIGCLMIVPISSWLCAYLLKK